MKRKNQTPNGTASVEPKMAEFPPHISGSAPSEVAACPSYLFAEKLVPVVVDLFLQAPVIEKYIIFPEIIQSLGRCMTTRRDNPDGSLWRVAVEGFNHVLIDDICKFDMTFVLDSKFIRPARVRIWKEVADVYEVFLVGHCGRPIPSHSLSALALKADEVLEMNILNILGDKILRSVIDAPPDSLQRLVSTIDCCASRTCSLPVQTVELMPSHCGRFSLMCLQKLFSLSSYDEEASDWNATRSEVSKISIMILMARCEYILSRFQIDENVMGERSLPMTRLEEITYVLQELAHLKVHPETLSALPLHPYFRNILTDLQNHDKRPHLLLLFRSFCELVTTREERVRELVQVLLRLITRELALDRVSISR